MNRRALVVAVLGCVAAVLCSLVAFAAPTAAETRRGTDPRGDVLTFDERGNLVRTGLANGDIVRYRVSYNRQRLQVVLRYRALNYRRDGHTAAAILRWRDADRQVRIGGVGIGTSPSDRAGSAETFGLRRPCRVRHQVSYRDNRITFRIPSRCFGAPRQVGIQIVSGSFDFGDSLESIAIDGAPGDGLFGSRVLRVRRG